MATTSTEWCKKCVCYAKYNSPNFIEIDSDLKQYEYILRNKKVLLNILEQTKNILKMSAKMPK
jgi:hypothetical protein